MNVNGTPTETATLLNNVIALVRRYVVLGDNELIALALWTAHTHLFRVGENGERDSAFEVTPYVAVSSAVPGCGKSLLLEVLEPIVARAWKTGGTTTATIIRKVHALGPTLLLDEVDQALHREKEYVAALQGLLNDGYRRRGTYDLCVPKKDGGWDFASLRIFCPKAFAGLRDLPDTLASRSIPIKLRMKTLDETAEEKFEDELWDLAEPVHQGLVAWADTHFDALQGARPKAPDELKNPRTKEVWRPLLAVADLAGGSWPGAARRAAVALAENQQGNDDTLNIELLADIRRAFDDAEADRMSSTDLIRTLASRDDGPWTSWWDDNNDKLGKGSGRKLANRLRVFGIHSKDLRFEGYATPLKGFARSDFEDEWRRHLPTSEKSATTATHATTASTNGTDGADVADVAHVADSQGGGCRDCPMPLVCEAGSCLRAKATTPSA